MNELDQIVRFLRTTPPFDAMPEHQLGQIAAASEMRYARSGHTVLEAGAYNDRLFVIRSGAVELRLAGEELTARLTVGASFAYPSLLRGGEVANTAIAMEDSLLLAVPDAVFHKLREDNEAFRNFFTADEARRLRHALKNRKSAQNTQFETLLAADIVPKRRPVSCTPDTSIHQAATLMRDSNVSTLAVCSGDELLGIFTDKDLRNRVVAAEAPLSDAVSTVMTPDPKTLPCTASVAEAMALMAAHGFRHIPLLDETGALSGMMSGSDILAHLGSNAIDHGAALSRARDAKALIAISRETPRAFAEMERAGLQARQVMRFTSALGEAAHRRAAQLAESELGEPPCPYALVVFGSLARQEQLIGSDQDNGFVIGGEMDDAARDYFAQLGGRISDILDAAGYDYCKGGIMAKNTGQRLTLAEWRDRYARWITQPDEDAILRSTIYFDMRSVHGDASLVTRLHGETVKLAQENRLFLSFLARDALRSRIPLGVFGGLVLEPDSEGKKVFDSKGQAIIPLVDIARTLSLASGVEAVSSAARYAALADGGHMDRGDARSLRDAMNFVNDLRIAHQARQVREGRSPDSLIAPDTLSPLEREHLKDSFAVIRRALDSLRRNLAGGIA
ncbi:DUF294 nucleotidyltransferase-like domain-containing protein [Aurantiacibacter gangjinensis]|uniref:Uncharacterized protein n=1 Tax=Aurantiacibacter gangjinensis TaxID=502682 RepID=A0A0G9MV39_9SPHN|nr:DUF294 nucleotidyltransferase-like domain-containing protein [Aurantiacibacter gangjinensis]APE29036.1 putative signal-transduction protein containing cAMP-binding and CBS domains [Aurantiacibacter gangjinensis]KLE33133.1 hypothetical protein AAW01_03895 [Aurantiacibacter gangjinensis]